MVGTAITGIATATLTSFSKQQSKFSEVAAKTGVSVEELRATYGDAAREISEETGIALTSILDGFQKAISAGMEGESAIKLVGSAAKAEAAGIGALTDQISSATTVTAVFGEEGSLALDKIVRAAQLGEGDTEDFARALKGAVGIAKPLKAEFSEVAAALAAVSQTAKSVPIGESQLRGFLGNLVSPSQDAKKALDEFTGGLLSFEQLQKSVETDGLASVLATMQTIAGGDASKIARLFPREEAQQFFNTVDPNIIRELNSEIAAGEGTVFEAFEQGANDVERQLNMTKQAIINLAAEIGETLVPAFQAVNTEIQKVVGWFQALEPEQKKLIGQSLILGPLLLLVGLGAAILSSALGPLVAIIKGIGPAFHISHNSGWRVPDFPA